MMRVGSRTFAGVLLALGMASCGRDALFSSGEASRLRIEPGSRTLFANQVFGFRVLQVGDGLTTDITQDPELVLSTTVDGIVDVERGQGQAVNPGTTELVATLGASSTRVRLEVLADELVGLEVEPSQLRLAVGAEVQLEVTGTLSSGDQVDLSAGAEGTQYDSSAAAASVSEDGLVRGVAPGNAVVGITQVGQQASVAVEVAPLPDDLVAIRVEPDPLVLAPNEERRVRVLGIDQSGASLVLPVEDLSFEIANRSVARVDAVGNVRALGQQAATNLTVEFADLATVSTVRVERPDATLESLSLEPDGGEISVGERLNLTLIARFNDGSARDVALEPESSFSATGGALSVSNDGLLIGNSPGTAVVTAQFGGREVSAEFSVVGNVDVDRLVVEPSPVALEVGGNQALTITAFFSDGSEDDVTELAELAPLNNAVRWEPEQRRLVGVQEGAGTLRFRFGGGTTVVPFAVIEDFDQVELFFTPQPIEVERGQSQSFQLFARLPNGDSVDATNFPGVMFEMADTDVATLELPPEPSVRGVSVGVTTLTATFQDISASTRVVVAPDTSQVVSLIISSPTVIPLNQPFQIQVIGVLADGNAVLLNGDPSLTVVGNPSAIVVVNQSGASIELRGARAGTGAIEASFRNLDATRSVRVLAGADPVVSIFFDPDRLDLNAGQVGSTLLRARRASGAEFIVGPNAGLALVPDLGITASQGATASINVSGLTGGEFQVRAFFQGLSSILPVRISGSSMIVGIQLITLDTLDEGDFAEIRVLGTTADGGSVELTDDPGVSLSTDDPMVARVVDRGWEAVSFGTTVLRATFGMLQTAIDISVNASRTPTLAELRPDTFAIQGPNDPDRRLEVRGTDLLPGDSILVDGVARTVIREAPGRLVVTIPGTLLTSRSTLPVQAETPAGRRSNALDLEVADPPSVDRFYPDAAIRGGVVRVRLFGANFEDATVAGFSTISISNIEISAGEDELSFDADLPATLTPATYTFTVTTVGGTATVQVEVESSANDLTISGSRDENGTILVDDLTITRNGRLSGNGPQAPIVIIASGDVTIDGEILVSGDAGKAGTTPSGGAGGPGGAGGGGGGSGLNSSAALGGSGQPSGQPAAMPSGVGTGGGDGGGEGAGEGAASTPAPICGTSGGGGAGASNSGDGGDSRFGFSSGGAAPGRSLWFAGAGGGGGNSCGGANGPEPDTAGSGGGGGGLIEIQLTHGGTLTVNGDVLARGGVGGDGSSPTNNSNDGGAGGGGGGGVIRLIGDGGNIFISSRGTLDVRGGDGGRAFGALRSGGGGGGGTIYIDARGGLVNRPGTLNRMGGSGGTAAGAGGMGTLTIVP